MPDFGIYVHIPFCQKKCKYCDFTSFDTCDEKIKSDYVQAILKEIEKTKIDQTITTIYIGGGTPSIFSAEQIEAILNAIQKIAKIQSNAEISIEINPGTVDVQKLQMYKKMGINRLSIGLQSTQNRLLKMLGRIHLYEDFVKIYKEARNVRI